MQDMQLLQNYDAVFKDALTLFKDKTLDFLGIESGTVIKNVLSTEKKEILVESEFSDLTFEINRPYGIHMEFEKEVSFKDLLRFFGYSVDLWKRYGKEFVTVIVTSKKPSVSMINGKTLNFKPIIINMGERDADALINGIRDKINKGEQVNELDLIFLPLCKSETRNKTEILKDGLELVSTYVQSEISREKIGALMMLLSNKYVEKEQLELLWKEFSDMIKLKILEVAEEKGMEKGMEKGIEKGMEKGFGIIRDAIMLYKNGESIADISNKFGISTQALQDIIAVL